MRRIHRMAKSAIVLTIVFMMTVDTANACRLFHWVFAHRGACCVSTAQDCGVQLAVSPPFHSSPVIESAPIVYGESISGDCCCCGGEVIESYPAMVEPGYVDDGYIGGGHVESYPVETEVYGGEVIIDASPADVVPMDSIVSPAPSDDIAPVPDVTTDDVDEPADNPLDAPADDATNDLFPPADDAAPADDVFEAPADDVFEAPADDVFETPADDVFEAPADDGFGEPADGGFGAPAGDDAAAGADGFGEPIEDAAAEPGGDAPTENFLDPPADDAPAGDDELFPPGDEETEEDLFGGTDDGQIRTTSGEFEDAPAEPAPADAGPVEEAAPAADAELEDLFGQNRPKDMRVWTDDTGTFRTVGRLVVIAKTHVRLLKDNGRHSTVPLHRLSNQDLDYVMLVAKRLTGTQRIASR